MSNFIVILFVLAIFIIWCSFRSDRIRRDRIQNLKTILNATIKLLDSDTSDIYLYNVTYKDAYDAMYWFYGMQNRHLHEIPKKHNKNSEFFELIKKFQVKDNKYRTIKNSESFLLQIISEDYLIILSDDQSSTLLEIEKVTPSTPLQGSYPYDSYAPNWNGTSRQYREKLRYKCQDCGVNLSNEQYLLHTHHKNRDKGDNREKNLIALCALCHQKQPYHERRLFVSDSDSKKIGILRKQQGLRPQ